MTRLCRFNEDRLGIVEGDQVLDVTEALGVIPEVRWPYPVNDALIANLDAVLGQVERLRANARTYALAEIVLKSPVANPPKVIAAPVNYLKHQAEANADGGKNFDMDVKTIDYYGLFLKSGSSVVGVGEGVVMPFPDRRTDHEIELVVVIGKGGRNIPIDRAREHIAGYALGLDITLRGPEDRSLRKSCDSFSVIGPWLVTADEVSDPNALDLTLEVNGEPRQSANTRDLIFNVDKLIEYASTFYELMPGDVIFTGTPEGVGPILPGDKITCGVEGIAQATVMVR